MIQIGRKRVSVTKESKTGKNTRFKDNYNGKSMTKKQFVDKIKSGEYQNYHVRKINGADTPVSNPDKTKNNNLD